MKVLLICLLVVALLAVGCTAPVDRPGASPTSTTAPAASVATVTSPGATSVLSTPAATYTLSGTTGGTLSISVLDVGQGDSILIRTPGGKTMLVDAGESDAGSRVVADLRSLGIVSLDAAVATHAHADHIGGYQTILSTFPVGVFYDSGYPATSATYERLLTTIDQKNIRYVTPTRGQTIDLDPAVRIDVFSPDGSNKGEIHDNMLVLRLSYGTFSALLAGDMPDTLEREIAGSLQPTTVLKVGHHGSATSTSAAFLNIVQPKVAIISVGAGNSYGHPTAATLQRLANVGATVYRTDLSGTVTVTTDGATYSVATERGSTAATPAVPPTTARSATRATAASAAPASSGSVAITALDLKGEIVTIANSGSSSVSLARWKLTDGGAKHTYTFGGTRIPAGGSITIASGTASGDIKWTSTSVWNNDGDAAYLYDAAGSLVSSRKG